MGIPGLFTKLQPYTKTARWTQNETGANVETVDCGLVIDGPAFAFWVFGQCSERIPGAHPFEAVASYSHIGNAAVSFLGRFEAVGLHVKHIFFDGALPSSKMETRLSRLEESLRQLIAIRSQHTELAVVPGAKAPVSNMPASRYLPAPAPAFLVSAVLDALLDSAFESRTEVVPCEADNSCADPKFCGPQDIILTGDSDLVIHEPAGQVMFFSDINFSGDKTMSGEVLSGRVISSRDLTHRLEVTDLPLLAFFLSKDNAATLKSVVSQMQQLQLPWSTTQEDFEAFKSSYVTVESAHPAALSAGANIKAVLTRLDPRVSELVYDKFCGSRAHDARIYLGVLYDDPSRASAWRCSFEIRQLAYSVLSATEPCILKMLEVDRRGSKATASEVNLLSLKQMEKGSKDISNAVLDVLRKFDAADDISRWRLFALRQVLTWEQDNGKRSPGKTKLLRLLKGQQKRFSWADMHLSAQIESVLYSLRMIRQVLEVHFAHKSLAKIEHTDQNVKILFETLSGFPTIAELMPLPCSVLAVDVASADMEAWLDDFFPKIDLPDKTTAKKGGRKRRHGEHASSQSSKGAQSSGNIYSLLGEA